MDFFLELENYKEVELENGSKEGILTLRSTIKPVEIKVHTLLDGTAMFTRWLEVTNLSDKDMALSRMSVLSGALEYIKDLRFYNADAAARIFMRLAISTETPHVRKVISAGKL